MLTEAQLKIQTLGNNENAKAILHAALQSIFTDEMQLTTVENAINDKFYEFFFPFLYDEDGSGDRRWRGSLSTLLLNNQNVVAYAQKWQALATDTGDHVEQWSGSDTELTTKNPTTAKRTFTDNLMRQTQTRYKGVGGTSSQSLADLVIDSPTEGNNTQIDETVTSFDGTDTKELQKGTKRTYSDGRTQAAVLAENQPIKNPLSVFINLFGCVLIDPFYKDKMPVIWGCEVC